MRERYEHALKIACAVLAAVLLFQSGRVTLRRNPLSRIKIPDLPTLASTNDASSATKATNNAAGAAAAKGSTNNVAKSASSHSGTNAALGVPPLGGSGSNKPGTNIPILASKVGTNGPAANITTITTTLDPQPFPSTNSASNLVARTESGTNASARTNMSSPKKGKGPAGSPEMAMMAGGFPGRGGKKSADLPPAVQARVDKITDSEILGPVIRPQPMALMGIVGNVAMLRAPNGQTGVVKEGDELGGLKLLRIGTNRVLVEKEGQKSELMIFSGYGSESIMPKETHKTNEPAKKP